MNNSGAITPLTIIGAMIAALYVIASILLGGGNELAALCDYLLAAAVLIGLLFPKGSILVWLFLCAYTDLLKRFLIVSGRVSYTDLFSVLGIPPAMLGGIVASIILSALMGKHKLTAAHWRLFLISCVLVILSGVLAASEGKGGIGGILSGIANNGFYAMLLFVIPCLYKTSDEALRLLKSVLWIFLPVALYGIYQAIFGFQEFEIAYLKTGLSIEIKQLFNNEVRPFSTLNSPTALSAICGALAALAAVLTLTPHPTSRRRVLGLIQGTFCTLIYLVGLIASTTRSSFIILPFVICGAFYFCSSRSTKLLYVTCAIAFLALVLSADFLLSNLGAWQSKISDLAGESEFGAQMARVATFSDRLMGFALLTKNPEVYTLFGYGADRGTDGSDPFYCHDLITGLLVRRGLLGLVLALGSVALALTKAHSAVLSIRHRPHRRIAATLLALSFSFVLVSVISGSILHIFPVNVFLWFFLGLLVLVSQSAEATAEVEVEAATTTPSFDRKDFKRFSRPRPTTPTPSGASIL